MDAATAVPIGLGNVNMTRPGLNMPMIASAPASAMLSVAVSGVELAQEMVAVSCLAIATLAVSGVELAQETVAASCLAMATLAVSGVVVTPAIVAASCITESGTSSSHQET